MALFALIFYLDSDQRALAKCFKECYYDIGLLLIYRVFGSVVVVAFQIIFRAEKHANNVFLFFKNYF